MGERIMPKYPDLILKSLNNYIEIMNKLAEDQREQISQLEAEVDKLRAENEELNKRIGEQCC